MMGERKIRYGCVDFDMSLEHKPDILGVQNIESKVVNNTKTPTLVSHQKLIKEMLPGEKGYALPWSLIFTFDGKAYLHDGMNVHPNVSGTVSMPITRIGDNENEFCLDLDFDFAGKRYLWERYQNQNASNILIENIVSKRNYFKRTVEEMVSGEKGFIPPYFNEIQRQDKQIYIDKRLCVEPRPYTVCNMQIERYGSGDNDYRVWLRYGSEKFKIKKTSSYLRKSDHVILTADQIINEDPTNTSKSGLDKLSEYLKNIFWR